MAKNRTFQEPPNSIVELKERIAETINGITPVELKKVFRKHATEDPLGGKRFLVV